MAYQTISIDSILKKGKHFESKKEYIVALDWYNEALSKGLSIHEDAQILTKIADLYYNLKEYRKSNLYYSKATKRDSSDTFLIKNYIGISYTYRKLSVKDSALHYAKKANKINRNIPDSYFKANSNYKIGFIYKNYGLNDKALSSLLNAYDGFKKYDDQKNLANSCNTIGFIHRLQGNSSASLTYYHKAKNIRKKLNDIKGLSSAYNNLGNSHKAIMQLDSALYYYQESFKLKQQNNLRNKGFTLHNIGTIYYMKGDNKKAKAFYIHALEAKKAEKDINTQIYTYNELSLIAITENNLILGKVYLDSSKNYIKGINEPSLRWHELQKILLYKNGDYKEAFEHQKIYLEFYKKLYNTQKSKAIIDSQEKFDTNKKVQKIASLTEVNKETTETLNSRTLYLTGTLITLFLVLVVYYITHQKQKLKMQKEDIQNLKELFKSQDIVRNKIGRDLHDIVKSKYEGIRLMITSLSRSSQLSNHIQEINCEISNANEQVRTLSHRLSPLDQRIRHSSLGQIIRAELNKLQLYSDIEVIITSDFPDIWNKMRLESKNHLYGIILESINNIRDHSGATEIIITSSITGNSSKMTITDNGIGNGATFKEGIGIGNMKSRAKLIHGLLKIKTSVTGFQVGLEFSINKNIQYEV